VAELTLVLTDAVKRGASDIHLVAGKPPIIRVNGEIYPLEGLPALNPDDTRSMIYSVLYEDQRARFEKDWELDCSLSVPNVSRFRINVYNQRKGVGAVLRVIPSKIPTPQEIGLMPSVSKLCTLPHGLVLVTGPTGSGKSTTLASLVELINQQQRKTILTVEDPIEFVYEDKSSVVLQREVGQQTRSFSEALRHAMRQDPDVILVGEMRDLETISLAITAAETGHLCFGTLHTQDAPTSVDRIIDVFPPHQQEQIRVQLSFVLQGVFAQQLLPHASGTGRTLACEVLIANSAVRNLIREQKIEQIATIIQTGGKFGMVTMNQSLVDLYKKQKISYQEAVNRSTDPEDLKKLLQKSLSATS